MGLIRGDVFFEEDKAFIKIGSKTYQLAFANAHKKIRYALGKEIEKTGITQRLVVHPCITHFPGGQQPYRLGFQVTGFVRVDAPRSGISAQLEDFEFKLSGLWQFIPVCRVPCISIFKNFTKEQLEYIKSAPLDKKVNFMKAPHIPVIWRDASIRPFRFNPKLDKEQQEKASFVQIKASFDSDRDTFEFISLLGMPTEETPNHLKAGKKDKAEALKLKKAAAKNQVRHLPVGRTAAAKPQPVRRKMINKRN